MVRSVRILIVALSAALVLSAMQIDVSAKKKSSKRKNKRAQSAPVFVMPSMRPSVPATSSPIQRTPIVFTSPSLSEIRDEAGINNAPKAPSSSSGPVGTGTGDGDGPKKRTWTAVPSIVAAGALIISEFRLQGPNGITDEFIEIYNDFGSDHTVADSGAGTGYAIAASDGVARCVIPNGTVIPRPGPLPLRKLRWLLSGVLPGRQ